MDSRLYFVLGDLVSNVLVAAVIGWLSWLIIDTGTSMFFAMLIMMAVGMVAAMMMWLPLGVLFGAMEVMCPVMFSGMMSGMFIGMWAAMHPLSAGEAFCYGALIGLICINGIWIMNNQLRGVTQYVQENK